MRERWRFSALEHFVPNRRMDRQSDSLGSLTEPKISWYLYVRRGIFWIYHLHHFVLIPLCEAWGFLKPYPFMQFLLKIFSQEGFLRKIVWHIFSPNTCKCACFKLNNLLVIKKSINHICVKIMKKDDDAVSSSGLPPSPLYLLGSASVCDIK